MVHVALLRGINVGGSNKVEMRRLKDVFEEAGMEAVRTYINSGNVIFTTRSRSSRRLRGILKEAIEDSFGVAIDLIVRDSGSFGRIVTSIPKDWTNDDEMKCDVLFLWDEVDAPEILEELPYTPEIEDVKYVPGAVIRRVDRKDVTRSRMTKLVGSPLYQKMTVRNCNTARKLLALMEAV